MTARVVAGRYQLHTVLGRGGMATVWAGLDTRLDRPVAVKVLDWAATADAATVHRLDHEARTLARLTHPNIVAVYDVGIQDDVPYIVMEFVDGENLHQRLVRGPLGLRQTIAVAVGVCDALTAAHESGVVHGDIKPDNILLSRAGAVKVCDFGIARLQQSARTSTAAATPPPVAVGTAEYMAPEQATGAPVTARTDLYALGCVLHSTLTGHPPFVDGDPMRVIWRQVNERPPPVASPGEAVPADLTTLVDQLLAKDPAHRPASADQVRARLTRLQISITATYPTVEPAAALAARASAAVPTRTRTMPAVAGQPGGPPIPPARTGLRLGPAGIAAVAVGAAAITALVMAVIIAVNGGDKSTPRVGAPTTGAAVSAAPPPTTEAAVPDPTTTDGVRAVIQAQLLAGELGGDEARDLNNRLDRIDRDLNRGRVNSAANKINDARERLDDFRDDDRIGEDGYTAILAAFNGLADALPQQDDHGDGDNGGDNGGDGGGDNGGDGGGGGHGGGGD
jgi:eukaryotic-like serine/threonine-protein kinase